jgi:hypothetical protein
MKLIQVHVYHDKKGGWYITVDSVRVEYALFKFIAVKRATIRAKTLKAELYVHNRNGQYAYRNSYGHDPRESKG